MSLNLIILIFSSRHRLHLLLKLFAVKDFFLMIFCFTWGVSPHSYKAPKVFRKCSRAYIYICVCVHVAAVAVSLIPGKITCNTFFVCFITYCIKWFGSVCIWITAASNRNYFISHKGIWIVSLLNMRQVKKKQTRLLWSGGSPSFSFFYKFLNCL